MRTSKGFLCGIALAVFLSGAISLKNTSSAAQASPSTASAQDVDDMVPARASSTFREDLDLTNQCVEAGSNKADCLCVTRVLKYELSLREYRITSQLFGKVRTPDHTAIKLSLINQGYKTEEINRLSLYTGKLTQADDFQARCQMADAYFAAELN